MIHARHPFSAVKHFSRLRQSFLNLLLIVLLCVSAKSYAFDPTPITVTTLADHGSGSLRQAIINARAVTWDNSEQETLVINFDIQDSPTNGEYIIKLESDLDEIYFTDQQGWNFHSIEINARTQTGNTNPTATPIVVIEPALGVTLNTAITSLGNGRGCLLLGVVGLTIRNFQKAGICMQSGVVGDIRDCAIYNIKNNTVPTQGAGIIVKGSETVTYIKNCFIGTDMTKVLIKGCNIGIETNISNNGFLHVTESVIANSLGNGINAAFSNSITPNGFFFGANPYNNLIYNNGLGLTPVGKAINYIVSPPNDHTIKLLNLSYNAATRTLTGNIDLPAYYNCVIDIFGGHALQNTEEFIISTEIAAQSTAFTGSFSVVLPAGFSYEFISAQAHIFNSDYTPYSSEIVSLLVAPPNPCTGITIDNTRIINLVSPQQQASIDQSTGILQFNVNALPADITGTGSLLVELYPEVTDATTGILGPDWANPISITLPAAASVGNHQVNVSSLLPAAGNIPKYYYWRAAIVYTSATGAKKAWSDMRRFILKPYDPPVPASDYLDNQHTNDINWVYTINYLDNGKTNEGIAYIDGLGKSRQMQSKVNSANRIMAVEAAYSEEGGGTVMTLPAPLPPDDFGTRFGYAPRFFDVLDGIYPRDFSTQDFDRELKGSPNTLMSPAAVDNSVGVGKYYSSTNPDKYVDDADGYPYAYNVGGKSPLQRPLLSAAGAGATFKITGGKEYKHFYDLPSNEELYKIYGSTNAPQREKVSRSITFDPDGIGHISYKDNENKLIATALTTCSNVSSLKPLQEDGMAGLTVHINGLETDQTDYTSMSKTASSKFLIPCGGTAVAIKHSIDLAAFKTEGAPCLNCKYQVSVKIVNEASGEVVLDESKELVPATDLCAGAGTAIEANKVIIDKSIVITTAGSYLVNRTIKPLTDPVTGETVLSQVIKEYTNTVKTNKPALFEQFKQKYNSETTYFLLRGKQIGAQLPVFANGWYLDKVEVKDLAESPYTKVVSGLDGVVRVISPQGSHLEKEYDQKLTSISSAVASQSLRTLFFTTYKQMHGVDLTTTTDPITVYTPGAGSDFIGTLPILSEQNIFDDAINPVTCYLIKVNIPKQCEAQCDPQLDDMNCPTRCAQQKNYYLSQRDGAYEELSQSTSSYNYNNQSYTLKTLTDTYYPFNSDVYDLLKGDASGKDAKLYEQYYDKRLIVETFSEAACLAKCNSPNTLPSPCELCQPNYANTVQDNINDLTAGYDYLIEQWDAEGNFPFNYDELMPFKTGSTTVRIVNSDLQEKLSFQLHKYLSDKLALGQEAQINVKADWEMQGGVPCPNCQAPAHESTAGEATCSAGPVRDISILPSKLIPLLILANDRAEKDYEGCLAMNGSPAVQKAYLCEKDRKECVATLGSNPTPEAIAACTTAYDNCMSSNPTTPTSIDLQRKAMIQQVLRNLYSDPSQAQAFDTETITLMNSLPPNGTSGLSLAQTAEFLSEYETKRACALSCQKSLEQSFISWLEQQVKQTISNITTSFKTNCFGKLNEKMDISYQQTAYHYTLYNYDKANRLVSTVPPEGVDYIDLNDAAQYNATTKTTRTPVHRMQTSYKHNSLYTLGVSTPDEGETRYIYDVAGRLRFSQTSEQRQRSTTAGYKIFSFITYDNETRVKTTGEYKDLGQTLCYWNEDYCQADNQCSSCTGNKLSVASKADDYSWPQSNTSEVVKIIYDTPAITSLGAITASHAEATYTQQRVAAVWNESSGVQTHYSYDAHGRVKYVLQNLPSLVRTTNPTAGFKYTDYQYQNRTGRIDKIIYQKDSPQEYFEHRYTYDDDYRLITAEVSRNGTSWIPAANYEYYLHGPLKRSGLGNKIQDIDYTYNINGWLKAINNPLSTTFANDDNENATDPLAYAPDVFSEAVNYYAGDYKRTQVGLDPTSLTAPQANTKLQSFVRNLYSGNISSTVSNTDFASTSIPAEQKQDNILAQGFNYDYLNRLTDVYSEIKAENFTSYASGQYDAVLDNNYATHIKYDANGNIKTLDRYVISKAVNNGVTTYSPKLIDRLTYKYNEPITAYGNVKKKADNRLQQVIDAVGANASGSDISTQPADNYTYDDKGRITADKHSSITKIEWTSYDKVKSITKSWGSISFVYNAHQQRIAKNVTNTSTNTSIITYYIYDANGVLMSTYEQTTNTQNQATTDKLLDFHTYGLSRLGTYAVNENLTTSNIIQAIDFNNGTSPGVYPDAAACLIENGQYKVTPSVTSTSSGVNIAVPAIMAHTYTVSFDVDMGTTTSTDQLRTLTYSYDPATGSYANMQSNFITANGHVSFNYTATPYSVMQVKFQYAGPNINSANHYFYFDNFEVKDVNIPTQPQYAAGNENMRFELSDHLGSVRGVVTGVKKPTGEGIIQSIDFNGGASPGVYPDAAACLIENGRYKVTPAVSSTSSGVNIAVPGVIGHTYSISFDVDMNNTVSTDQLRTYTYSYDAATNSYGNTQSNFITASGHVSFNYTAGPYSIMQVKFQYAGPNPNNQNHSFYFDNFVVRDLGSTAPFNYIADAISLTDYFEFGMPMTSTAANTEQQGICVSCGQLKTVYDNFVTANGSYTETNAAAFATYANQQFTVTHDAAFYKEKLLSCNVIITTLALNSASQTGIVIPASPQLSFGTSDFTIDTWVKYTGNDYHTIVSNLTPAGYKGMDLFIYNNKLYLYCIDDGPSVNYSQAWVPNSLSQNTWVHIVAIRKGNYAGNFKFYINGALAASEIHKGGLLPSGNLTNNLPWHIGMQNNNDRLTGNIKDLKIYSREITAQDVQTNYNSCSGASAVTDGLVLHLPLNEGTANLVHDISSFGVTGTISATQAPQWITSTSPCIINSSQGAFCENTNQANNNCVSCGQLKTAYDDFITANGTYNTKEQQFATFTNQRFGAIHNSEFYKDKLLACSIVRPLLQFNPLQKTTVIIPKSTQLNFNTGDFTIDTWIKYTGIDYLQIIQNMLVTGPLATGVDLFIYANKLHLWCGDGTGNYATTSIESNTPIPQNQWVHVVAIRKGNLPENMKFYINGQLVPTNLIPGNNFRGPLLSGNVNSEADWIIGSWRNDQYFNGNIRDLKLYNRELTSLEIQTNYSSCAGVAGVTNGQVLYLPLNEGVNDVVKDNSNSALVGIINKPQWNYETIEPSCINVSNNQGAFCDPVVTGNKCTTCGDLKIVLTDFVSLNGNLTDANTQAFATFANQSLRINHTSDFYKTKLNECNLIKVLNVLNFNPSQQTTITIPKSTQLNFSTGDFTIDTWIKYSGTDYLQIIQNLLVSGNTVIGIDLFIYNNKLHLWCGDGIANYATSSIESNTPIPQNQLLHIVAIRKGNLPENMKFYINGQLVPTNLIPGNNFRGPLQNGSVNSTSDWVIGNWQNAQYFNGSIRDLKLYNRELTASDIQTNYNACAGTSGVTDGLVLYLPLNEGTGNAVHDLSSFGITGTINQTSPQWLTDNYANPGCVDPTQIAFCETGNTNGGGTVLYAGRAFNLGASRYGYQGSEQDGEITGHSGMDFYTTEYRMLDVRLGRWFSSDPVVKANFSPYNSMSNNPIWRIDPKGADDFFDSRGNFINSDTKKTRTIFVMNDKGIKTQIKDMVFTESNVDVLANIMRKYAKEAGIDLTKLHNGDISIGTKNYKNTSSGQSYIDRDNMSLFNDGFIASGNDMMAASPRLQGISVNLSGGKLQDILNDGYNVITSFIHEKDHLTSNLTEGFDEISAHYAEIISSQFKRTTKEYQNNTNDMLDAHLYQGTHWSSQEFTPVQNQSIRAETQKWKVKVDYFRNTGKQQQVRTYRDKF